MESIDILYLTLSVCIALFTIFVSITLLYLLLILRDVVKIVDRAKDLMEKVDTYVTKPLLMTKRIIEFVKPFIDSAEGVVKGRRKKR